MRTSRTPTLWDAIKQKGALGTPKTKQKRGRWLPPLCPGMGPSGVENIQHREKMRPRRDQRQERPGEALEVNKATTEASRLILICFPGSWGTMLHHQIVNRAVSMRPKDRLRTASSPAPLWKRAWKEKHAFTETSLQVCLLSQPCSVAARVSTLPRPRSHPPTLRAATS